MLILGMTEGSFLDRVVSKFRRSKTEAPQVQPVKEVVPAVEYKSPSIIGEVIIGHTDPSVLTQEQFNSHPNLLYHGAKRNFVYSHKGEYDINKVIGTTDYGAGFYTTDDPKQAENYSNARGAQSLTVYSFLPQNARMLDVRNKDNPNENGVLPKEFVEKWLSYLNKIISDPTFLSDDLDWIRNDLIKNTQDDFLDRVKKYMDEQGEILIRTDVGGSEGIFDEDGNGLIDSAFRNFMLGEGYDGMIYREAGEGEKAEDLTGYVFYNPSVIDTFEGWQKRK